MAANPSVVTRFAPSPTGRLHIGGARTALFNWAWARKHKGHFVLRIEDTDQARSSDEATTQILESLAWLGLDWDEGPALGDNGGDPRSVGPFFQAQRLETYHAVIDRLLEMDRAYHAFETPEELDALRKEARAAKRQFRYNRAALDIPKEERLKRAKGGEAHVIRFRMPDEAVTVHDEIRGEVTVQPEELEDFVILKKDRYPTYHFAVVCDDEAMGVTHVVRGQEHLPNTFKHVALQQALGYGTPVYAHLPLIFSEDGSKMSKRDKDKVARNHCKQNGIDSSPDGVVSQEDFDAWMKDSKSQLPLDQLVALAGALGIDLPEIDVTDFDEAGYLREVVCNYISLLGWSPGDDVEKFDMDFLIERFELDRIAKTNAKFDRKKLLAFNTDAIAEMDAGEFASRWRRWCESYAPRVAEIDESRFAVLSEAVRPRSKTFRDAARSADFLFLDAGAIEYDPKGVKKWIAKNDNQGLDVLRVMRERLGSLESFDAESIHRLIEHYANEHGLGMGNIAQPMRMAMTGTPVSPPIDATVALVGREGALVRIDRAIEVLSSVPQAS
ncbi:MAG: glutamate--tRNA ligase [Phycisphaerales bacterium JB043]